MPNPSLEQLERSVLNTAPLHWYHSHLKDTCRLHTPPPTHTQSLVPFIQSKYIHAYTHVLTQHSKEDELLIQAALESGPREGHLMIFDARSFSAATGNKIMVCVYCVSLHQLVSNCIRNITGVILNCVSSITGVKLH